MRSNSGRDESRNNLHDSTMRDRSAEQEKEIGQAKPKAPADQREGRKD